MTQISIHPDIEYKTIANEYANLNFGKKTMYCPII